MYAPNLNWFRPHPPRNNSLIKRSNLDISALSKTHGVPKFENSKCKVLRQMWRHPNPGRNKTKSHMKIIITRANQKQMKSLLERGSLEK